VGGIPLRRWQYAAGSGPGPLAGDRRPRQRHPGGGALEDEVAPMPGNAAVTVAGKVIVNPLSGERIIIRDRPRSAGGVLAWELQLAPGGRVPASHAHPWQEERFTVQEGRLRFRIGWRRLVAGPGDTVCVPPGTVHHFANAGPSPARVLVETEPALAMAELLETAAAVAQDQQAAHRSLPRLTDLALFMHDFEQEVRAPYLPRCVASRLMRMFSSLACRWGRDARYRRLRGNRDGRPAEVPGRGHQR
jgi:quercetin dioxygenase-like cupin family protein